MLRKTCLIVLCVWIVSVVNVLAKETIPTVNVISAEKLGDFWGIEFPTTGAEPEATMGFDLYIDHKKEPIVRFSYSGVTKNQNTPWYSILYHVKQKKVIHREKAVKHWGHDFAETEQNKYIRDHHFIEVKTLPLKVGGPEENYGYIKTSRHHRWILISGPGSNCSPSLSSKIRVRDLKGELVAEKSLLYVSTKKLWHHSAPACVSEGNGLDRPRQLSVSSLNFFGVWEVDDGTVLTGTFDAPYLIRLTPKLTSPFLEHHPDIRFFTADIIGPLAEQFRAELKAYLRPNEDIYEKVDEALFRFLQHNLTIK